MPFLSLSSSFTMINNSLALLNKDARGDTVGAANRDIQAALLVAQKEQELRMERAEKIDTYFADRDMPLAGYGAKFIAEAEKNDIDWRLLPAIAIAESTGGRFACGQNPFGWGSCKIKFNSIDAAIETVAKNLGGDNPATERYYKGTSTEEKLHYYNGSVVPTYTAKVLKFMELIEKVDLDTA